MIRGRAAAAWCLTIQLTATALAAAAPPDLSGHWELRHDSRSVPQARLTAAARAAATTTARNDIEGLRWCRTVGLPTSMDGPIDIRQTAVETVIVSPMPAVARHVYTDGRTQVDPAEFDPTTVGFSVGHWDGAVFIVDTLGFSNRGLLGIPGGGFRSTRSRLSERYQLLDGGQRLSVTFTWTDAAAFTAPHSYEFRYYRAASTPTEWPCEPKEPGRDAFFAPAITSHTRP
jgi:hypothetical protein